MGEFRKPLITKLFRMKDLLVMGNDYILVFHPFADFSVGLASLSLTFIAFFEYYYYGLGNLAVPVTNKYKGIYVAR